jgi:hypothetical protein
MVVREEALLFHDITLLPPKKLPYSSRVTSDPELNELSPG